MKNKLNLPHEGIVIFAGAGCSKDPPSSLPTWNSLNDAILEALWNRLEPYGLKDAFREKILTAIRQKREDNKFPPDYQAQRMVERAGLRYFQLLSAVDSDSYNAVQYYTAILAKQGLVKAVVTTNFDRNFERAFDARDVPYHCYFDEEGFARLFLTSDAGTIPIIKIHGCCSSPGSLVDTRKQRLKGRAKSLENALLQLLQKYHFIFCGFSGQDLDDNKNYLGLRDAAPAAKGFTFLHMPTTKVRDSMNELIKFYGEEKAGSLERSPTQYLEQVLNKSSIPFDPFSTAVSENPLTINQKLEIKVNAIEPLDAINMLTGLAESYGDEISARYLYDKVWHERIASDYEGDALPRFLLNHGRSFVFNFQDKIERAKNAGVALAQFPIGNAPAGFEELYSNPAKTNLRHQKNFSPETQGLIGLVQTYLANPILFTDFPKKLFPYFRSEPDITERADIYYYYSFYALVHGDQNGIQYLNAAIAEMEKDFDEPRLSQLLSRRAMLLLRIKSPDFIMLAEHDAAQARALAEKYHEPHLLALSALATAILARNKGEWNKAFQYIREAETNYSELKRIPQYIETIVEFLKIILEGFNENAHDSATLFQIVQDIQANVEKFVVERINVFEPEYCYLMAMILYNYSDAPKDYVIKWFADSINLARQSKQEEHYKYFSETCRELDLLGEIEKLNSGRKQNG